MQKKSKKVLTAVMATLFVLSISYFALLSPTTAWYYQDASREYDFTFADFDVEQSANITDLNVEFRAATRFAAADEPLFDEVARVVKIRVTNNAGQKAFVHADVTQNNTTPGLHWFLYETATENEIMEYPDAAATVGTAKGAYKTALEQMLTDAGKPPILYSDEASYESSNAKALEVLNDHNKQGIVFAPGESKFVYIVLWAEYGEVFSLISTDTVQKLVYDVNVQCVAEPYHVQKATITVAGTAPVDILYAEGTDVATPVHVDGTAQFEGNVGARFTITLADESFAFDPANTDGTVSAKDSRVLTGTVNSRGNTITIVAAD